MAKPSVRTFPNYVQIQPRVPPRVWRAARLLLIVAVIELCIVLIVLPGVGLTVFWDLVVPVLPLLLLLAPGLWRNVCPVAAMNRIPRLLGLNPTAMVPKWLQRHGYLIGMGLFFGIIASRKLLFETSGPALAILLGGTLAASFVGGALVKGKSGWCTTLCPMLPVERLYGQTPFVPVRNNDCEPCVGCAKHCFDFNPQIAYLAEQHDPDRLYVLRRRLFAGAFPGLTAWFYLAPAPPAISVTESFELLALALCVSAGSFFVLDAVLGWWAGVLPALYGALALNLYYAYAPVAFFARLGLHGPLPGWITQATVALLSLVWLVRTTRKERQFLAARTRVRRLPLVLPEAAAAVQTTASRIASGMSKLE